MFLAEFQWLYFSVYAAVRYFGLKDNSVNVHALARVPPLFILFFIELYSL